MSIYGKTLKFSLNILKYIFSKQLCSGFIYWHGSGPRDSSLHCWSHPAPPLSWGPTWSRPVPREQAFTFAQLTSDFKQMKPGILLLIPSTSPEFYIRILSYSFWLGCLQLQFALHVQGTNLQLVHWVHRWWPFLCGRWAQTTMRLCLHCTLRSTLQVGPPEIQESSCCWMSYTYV